MKSPLPLDARFWLTLAALMAGVIALALAAAVYMTGERSPESLAMLKDFALTVLKGMALLVAVWVGGESYLKGKLGGLEKFLPGSAAAEEEEPPSPKSRMWDAIENIDLPPPPERPGLGEMIERSPFQVAGPAPVPPRPRELPPRRKPTGAVGYTDPDSPRYRAAEEEDEELRRWLESAARPADPT